MAFDDREKGALKKSVHWMRKIKHETMHSNPRHAYHEKLRRLKQQKHEDTLGLSTGQHDQKWIDKSKAIKQKISKTRVHPHKSPP